MKNAEGKKMDRNKLVLVMCWDHPDNRIYEIRVWSQGKF